MMNYIKKAIKLSLSDANFRKQKFFSIIFTLICAYISTCTISVLYYKGDILNKTFSDNISDFKFIIAIVICFVVWAIVSHIFKLSLQWITVILLSLYVIIAVNNMVNSTPYFTFVCIGIICIIVFRNDFLIKSDVKLSAKIQKTIILIISLLAITSISWVTILRFLSYESSNFDMGIFAQMYEYMARTGRQLTTVERNKLLSHFAVHFSPIYYILLPFYMIFRKVEFLLIAQAILIVGGVIPTYKLCTHYKFTKLETIFACIIYVLYPAFSGSCFYDFHENAFLPMLLLWVIYFFEKNNKLGAFLSSLLVVMVKEDAGLYLICIGLYGIFGRIRKNGLIVFFTGLLGFVGSNMFINHFGEGIKTNRYKIFITNENYGLLGVMINVIKNPVYFCQSVLSEEKWIFIILMTLPFIFMCFKIKKLYHIFLILPFIVVNLATDYPYQYDIYYQYVLGSGPLLFFLFIKNIMDDKRRTKTLLLAMLSTILLVNLTSSDKYQFYIDKYLKTGEQIELTNDYIDTLDKNSIIYADTYLIPRLYQFKNVYMLENDTDVSLAQVILLDNRRDNYQEKLQKHLINFPRMETQGFVTKLQK